MLVKIIYNYVEIIGRFEKPRGVEGEGFWKKYSVEGKRCETAAIIVKIAGLEEMPAHVHQLGAKSNEK